MTLFKQIQIFVTLLLLIILGVVLKINFDNAQDFVTNQLYSNAKNAANTMSLSLGTVTNDESAMSTMINAMFDGGYFERITLNNAEGETVYKREQSVSIDGVPEWFMGLVNFESPVAEAQVSSGWSIFGTLEIKGHPGNSYIRLWDTFKSLCIWFVVLGATSFAVSYVILKMILSSLTTIRTQAEAIGDNEFIINKNIPKTPEMKQVVIAMNGMVEKVQGIYNREIEALKQYQELKYKDQQTGLYNRNYFVKQLKHYIHSESILATGEVFILSFHGIDDAQVKAGHQGLAKMYAECGKVLTSAVKEIDNSVVAFMDQKEFAVITPAKDENSIAELAEEVHRQIMDYISSDNDLKKLITLNIGIASYNYEDSMGTVMSKVDYALSVAKSSENISIEHFNEQSDQAVLGKLEWKNMIEEAIQDKRFILTSQPVMSDDGELHQEIFINMVDRSGAVQRAGYFMPMVISLNLADNLDRYVLKQTIKFLEDNSATTVAINITDEFLKDRESFTWFRQFLKESKEISERLTFEISDTAINKHIDICLDFAGLVKGLGFSYGIDRFIMSESSLENLQKLKPDYIKIEQDYLIDSNDEDSNTALKSFLTISESLGIKLIATKVESSEQRSSLESKKIKYFQGRGIADISPLEGNNE
jgi:diguanylate cyclase (GGDEF)-like protein